MLNRFQKIFFLVSLLIFNVGIIFSQTTKIRGKIIDASTNEPLPFVNISFKGTQIGTITDFNGDYFLETRTPSDSLIFSYLGFKPKTFGVQKMRYQELNVKMESDNINLGEVIVLPGENPAHILLDKIITNKEINDPDRLTSYQYEVYSKIEIDVNNLDEEYKNQRVFKNFQFIFDYVDTSAITGKSYLPVFISETLSDYYFNRNPRGEKEEIKASKISGLTNESVSQLTGNLYQNINIYNNYINIFEKGFISPVANFGKAYYKYYLVDSMYLDNQWCYQISFKPKRKQEPTFTGDFWVHDTTFAIKKVQVRIAKDANINLVNDLVASYEYERVNNLVWFMKKENIFVDFNLSDKQVGFFGKKTTSYKNIVIEPKLKDDIFKLSQNIILDDSIYHKSDEFWRVARHEEISKKEEAIYTMVDSIREVPVFKTFTDLIMMFYTGYKVFGNFEFGPYYTMYSFNDLEGNRFRLGGRTSNAFSTKIMFDGFLAYGTKDQKFKYGGGFVYLFSVLPKNGFGASYKYDVEQLGQSQNAFMEDNILSSVLRRNPNNKLSMVSQIDCHYEKEWFQGFSNKISFSHRTLTPTRFISFDKIVSNETVSIENLTTSELTLSTHFAYKEKILTGKFERTSLGTKYPVLNLHLTAGIKDFFGSDYHYEKINFNIRHWFNVNPFGYFKYLVDVGKIFGNIPYPLLQLHEGNETYAFDEYSFNMMNYYEFVSDQYISLDMEHHFEGFFLNHFPLLRKLKWREVVSTKILYGTLRDENRNILIFPEPLDGLSKPYMEAGVGIENILKLIRIDALWRLSYLDNPDIPKFGIRAGLQFTF